MESEIPHYDFFIIGGGPGGNAAAKEAVKYKVSIGIADFVKPTPLGTSWGLGGTCVNVGCIPKKMMHYAGILMDRTRFHPYIGLNYKYEGTEISSEKLEKSFKWETLKENVTNHISGLNFGYKQTFRKEKIKYYNKFASFVDSHTIELTDRNGKKEKVTADKILIATGLRPTYPDLPGAKELCITSDDLFRLEKAPGKTLVVGASYIALECASFLRSLGFDVSVMVRSILLRGFDRDMANRVGEVLAKEKINFLNKTIPLGFYKEKDNKIKVEYKNTETGKTDSEIFDTVLLAIGRKPNCAQINIEKAGVKLAKSGKIEVDAYDKTNIDHIFAVGDISEGRPELAPPAIMAGKLLSRRLFGGGKATVDYNLVATTVYTRIEYSHCGLSEEEAEEKFGKENIKVYHSDFIPTEFTVDPFCEDNVYVKVIVNVKDSNRVVGWHILSPDAGEITQGIAVAMKMGLTKDQLDETVGIHPTIAEEMTVLTTTKDMGDGKKTGC